MLTKYKANPILRGLPEHLKDPKSYKRVEQRLRMAMVSDHKHKDMKSFSECVRCRKKVKRKTEIMKEEGFKSYEQLMEWRRVQQIMNNGTFEFK
jgi:hypothetical protein